LIIFTLIKQIHLRINSHILFFFILLFAVCSVFSQNNLNLISSNGKVFTVFINNSAANAYPEASVLIEGIKKDTFSFFIQFEKSEKYPLTAYLLDQRKSTSGKEFVYGVNFDENKIRLHFIDMYTILSLPNPLVPIKPIVDTSLNYRNKRLGHFCELNEGRAEYFNNLPKEGNCEKPMPNEYLSYISLLMSKADVEDDKFVTAENVCRNNCLSVEQVNILLTYINYEIEKLKLIRIAYFNLTDPQNKKNLEKSFRFESSTKELQNFLNNAEEYRLKSSNNCIKASEETDVNAVTKKLAAYANDAQRYVALKKAYSDLCYTSGQVILILKQFIHDREKLDAAKLLYFNCVEKNKYASLAEVFSYNQTTSELNDFIEKQTK
jgi:hypothetical protein